MSKIMSKEELFILENCRKMLSDVRVEGAKQKEDKNHDKMLSLARLEIGAYELMVKNHVHAASKDTNMESIKTTPKFLKDITSRELKAVKSTDAGLRALISLNQEVELVREFVAKCAEKTKGMDEKQVKEYLANNIDKLVKAQVKFDDYIKKTNGGILINNNKPKLN